MHIYSSQYNYILHGFPEVMLQSTGHEVILHGLREVTSKRQVISHNPSVTSIVSCIKRQEMHNIHLLKQLLAYVSVDLECNWTVNLIILTSALHQLV